MSSYYIVTKAPLNISQITTKEVAIILATNYIISTLEFLIPYISGYANPLLNSSNVPISIKHKQMISCYIEIKNGNLEKAIDIYVNILDNNTYQLVFQEIKLKEFSDKTTAAADQIIKKMAFE